MKIAKNLTSALLGIAMLAAPIIAAAQSTHRNSDRDVTPIYQQASTVHPGIVLVDHDDWREHHRYGHRWRRDRDDWRWRGRYRDGDWRYRRGSNRYSYNRYRTVCEHDGDDCRQVPQFWGYR